MNDLVQSLRCRTYEVMGERHEDALCIVAAEEIERLEKERFKYETALMLIGQGYPDAAGIANAAIGKRETV